MMSQGHRASPARPRVLVVDDEPNMCRSLAILVADEGRREVETARSGEEALPSSASRPTCCCATCRCPASTASSCCAACAPRELDVQVIMMTAYSTVQSAVEAMRLGAHEYLIKPFTNEEVCAAVDSALPQMRPEPRRAPAARRRRRSAGRDGRPLGADAAAVPRRRARRRDRRDRARHRRVGHRQGAGGARHPRARPSGATAPFVAVNCAALSAELLESELFGHERGAFTGAHKTKIGRLEQADGGTIFLDEVGDMSPALQTKLLRALEERSFERVGGLDTIHVDLRVVAATNQDLPRAIAEGRFREDLYYRLNVVEVTPPPLRERTGDLPLLCELFLAEKAAELGVPQEAPVAGGARRARRPTPSPATCASWRT